MFDIACSNRPRLGAAGRIAIAAVFAAGVLVAGGLVPGALVSKAEAAVSTGGEVASGRRAALVIGNSAYRHLPALPNAASDAERIRARLTDANFEVTLAIDQDRVGLEASLRAFLRTLNDGDVALLYYSGHAVQVDGRNYLLPVDADIDSPYDLELEAKDVTDILAYMQAAARVQILVLDACRDNPFRSDSYYVGERKVEVGQKTGLAPVIPGQGALIVFSTAPDQKSFDGAAGGLSPFSDAFSQRMLTPNVEVRELLSLVRGQVIEKTGGRQIPWDASSLTAPFFFMNRRQFLLVEPLHEVRAAASEGEVPLGLPAPVGAGDGRLTVRLDRVPRAGTLLGPAGPLAEGDSFDAGEIGALRYRFGKEAAANDLFSYTVEDAFGNKASGAVVVMAAPAGAAPSETLDAEAPAEPQAEPVSIRLVSDVGTGFAPLGPDRTLGEAGSDKLYRLASRAPGAQVALDGAMLGEGDVVRGNQIASIRLRPALGSVGSSLEVVLQPEVRSDAEAAPEPIRIVLKATENDCDKLAAEPLDVQAVSEGLLPDAIDVPAALAACRDAATRFPDVARFRFQLARALYADGRFAEAVSALEAAAKAGHVRAGYLLGRLYQRGASVPVDPARAVALFEPGAKRGDPYAQYSLGRALMDGKGIGVDVPRGLELVQRAAMAGHTYAMNLLGSEYLSGRRVAKDVDRAYELFNESSRREDIWGKVNLGVMYRDGVVVGKSAERARTLFTEADRAGHPYAARLIGIMDREAGADEAAQLPLFRRSGERGDGRGALLAADILAHRPNLATSGSEALRLYGLAAGFEATDPADKAMKALGRYEAPEIAREIQLALVRLGQYDGAIDGRLGPASRRAVAAILPRQPADGGDAAILVALLHEEWLRGRPRLDLL